MRLVLQGYSRKGAALGFLERYEDAVSAYKEGLKLEPDNEQLKVGLEDVKDRLVGQCTASSCVHWSGPVLVWAGFLLTKCFAYFLCDK